MNEHAIAALYLPAVWVQSFSKISSGLKQYKRGTQLYTAHSPKRQCTDSKLAFQSTNFAKRDIRVAQFPIDGHHPHNPPPFLFSTMESFHFLCRRNQRSALEVSLRNTGRIAGGPLSSAQFQIRAKVLFRQFVWPGTGLKRILKCKRPTRLSW